jgi:hypothetical protein
MRWISATAARRLDGLPIRRSNSPSGPFVAQPVASAPERPFGDPQHPRLFLRTRLAPLRPVEQLPNRISLEHPPGPCPRPFLAVLTPDKITRCKSRTDHESAKILRISCWSIHSGRVHLWRRIDGGSTLPTPAMEAALSDTSPQLPSSLLAELAAIQELPKSHDGPIADTYERLQGIPFLKAARPSLDALDDYSRLYIAFNQAQELAFYNVSALFRRCSILLSSTKNRDRIDFFSHQLRWSQAILRLSYGLAHSSAAILSNVSPGITVSSSSPALSEAFTQLAQLDALLLSYLEQNDDDIRSSIRYAYFVNSRAVSAHSFKSICYLLRTVSSVITNRPRDDLLSSETLRWAVHSLNTTNETYLMQFRLLHQIPEVLAAEAVPLLENATASLKRKRIPDAIRRLGLVNMALVDRL